MVHQKAGGRGVHGSGVAQIGAMIGPIIPYLIWLRHRNDEPTAARDAASATNFGTFVLASLLPATVLRMFAPWIGWVGAILQVAIIVSAVVLCLQAYGSVRRGVPATYPFEISLFKV